MPKLPSGTGQLNIAGLRNDIIDEFRKLQEIPGPVRRRKKTWEVFEMIWNEWKQIKATKPASAESAHGKEAHHGHVPQQKKPVREVQGERSA